MVQPFAEHVFLLVVWANLTEKAWSWDIEIDSKLSTGNIGSLFQSEISSSSSLLYGKHLEICSQLSQRLVSQYTSMVSRTRSNNNGRNHDKYIDTCSKEKVIWFMRDKDHLYQTDQPHPLTHSALPWLCFTKKQSLLVKVFCWVFCATLIKVTLA